MDGRDKTPFNHLPECLAVLFGPSDSVCNFERGIFRIVNKTSSLCLTYATPRLPEDRQCLTLTNCVLPGTNEELNQLWAIGSSPPSSISGSGSAAYPSHVIIESTSITPGSSHNSTISFRLDVKASETSSPIIPPIKPSGRDDMPNNLPPPVAPTPEAPGPTSFVVNPETAGKQQPNIANYVQPMTLSCQGSTTSLWQVVSVRGAGFSDGYLLFNPCSGFYLAGSAPGQRSSGASSTDQKLGDPSSAVLIDARKYLTDVASWLEQVTTEQPDTARALVSNQMRAFVWCFERADLGPTEGKYRIVHMDSGLAIGHSSSYTAAPVTLDRKATTNGMLNQVWQFSPSVRNRASLTYTITNSTKDQSLNGQWRCLLLPPSNLGLAKAVPNRISLDASQYLICNDRATSFLGLDSQHNLISQSVDSNEGRDVLKGAVPPWDNFATRFVLQDYADFTNTYSHLLWRLVPESWDEPDGVYSFSTLDMYLDIPPATCTSIVPISLSPQYPALDASSTWWRVTSSVEPKSGIIYQTVRNYRSGHMIAANANNSSVSGIRFTESDNKRWRLVKSSGSAMSVTFRSFTAINMGIKVQPGIESNMTVIQDVSGKSTTWRFEKVELGPPLGRYVIRNVLSGLYLGSNMVSTDAEPFPIVRMKGLRTVWNVIRNQQGFSVTANARFLTLLPTPSAEQQDKSTVTMRPERYFLNILPGLHGGFTISSKADANLVLASDLRGKLSTTVSIAERMEPKWTREPGESSIADDQAWQMIMVDGDNATLCPSVSVPLWAATMENSTLRRIDDGLYHIHHPQSNCLLTSSDSPGDQSFRPVSMTVRDGSILNSWTQIWYIRSEIVKVGPRTEQLYTITNMERYGRLQEKISYIGQPEEGIQLCTNPICEDDDLSYEQQWMVWQIGSEGTAQANKWALGAVGGSGGLLAYTPRAFLGQAESFESNVDVDTSPADGLLVVRPQSGGLPGIDQTWQLESIRTDISSGFYNLRKATQSTYLSVADEEHLSFEGTSQDIGARWKVKALPNGLVTIQSMSTSLFLNCDEQMSLSNILAMWCVSRVAGGVVMKCMNEWKGHNPKNSALPETFVLDRIDRSGPSFVDSESDMVVPGWYTITNEASGEEMVWPRGPRIDNRFWTICPISGFYTLALGGSFLGAGRSLTLPAFDAARWKLLKLASGSYYIINKVTGLLLAQTGDQLLEMPFDSSSESLARMKLVRVVRKPWDDADVARTLELTAMHREVQINNGLYILSNSALSEVVADLDSSLAAVVAGHRDRNPSSCNSRTQLWIVEQTRDGWYNIRSFVTRLYLGQFSGRYGSCPLYVGEKTQDTDTWKWKFLQDKTGLLSIIAKSPYNQVLSINPSRTQELFVVDFASDSLQKWRLVRFSSSGSDLDLAPGVYIFMKYLALNASSLQNQGQTATSQTAQVPAAITFDGASLKLMSAPLSAQSVSQYWKIAKLDNGYSIQHLSRAQYVSVSSGTATLSRDPYPWQIINQRLGGAAIFTKPDGSQASQSGLVLSVELALVPYIADDQRGGDTGNQRWQLRRTGFYLQNQGSDAFLNIASTATDFRLTPWRPYEVNSNASSIWHLQSSNNGDYALYSEWAGRRLQVLAEDITLDRRPSDGPKQLCFGSMDGTPITGRDQSGRKSSWRFVSSTGDTLSIQSNFTTGYLSVNQGVLQTALVRGGSSPNGWQFIGVSSVNRGPLASIPRYALVTNRMVWSDKGLVNYRPDDPYQRWRACTFGKRTIYINEATTGLLTSIARAPLDSLQTSNMQNVWWEEQADSFSRAVGPQGIQFTPVSNTGDLMPKANVFRIQVGDLSALSVQGTKVVLQPWDRFSDSQAWTYIDWHEGRYIKHVATNSLLQLIDGGLEMLSLEHVPYHQIQTLWKMKLEPLISPPWPGTDGFFALALAVGDQTVGLLNKVRFVEDSSSFTFTTRYTVLQRFLCTHAPIFCYPHRSSMPMSVEDFLLRSTTNVTASSLVDLEPNTTSVQLSDMSTRATPWPMSYVIVRDSPDSVYVNYTDFTFMLLSDHGWDSVVVRYHNETNNLIAAKFYGYNWVYNLDNNFSTTVSSNSNPLRILKRADGTQRLHVYVEYQSSPSPFFPDMKASDIVNDDYWSDSRGLVDGGLSTIVEAAMVTDEDGRGLEPPTWSKWRGLWGTEASYFPGL